MEEHFIEQFEDEGSIWFNKTIIPELLNMVPMAVGRCPDPLNPETLASGVLTNKSAGSLIEACFVHTPILRKQCTEMLADFILEHTQLDSVDTHIFPNSLSSKTLPSTSGFTGWSQSEILYREIMSICRSVPQMASSFREALVQRRVWANMVVQITVEVLKDELGFFTRILFGDMEICGWILSCMRLSRKRVTQLGLAIAEVEKVPKCFEALVSHQCTQGLQLEEAMIMQLRNALLIDAKSTFHRHGWSFHLYSHVKLYCILVSLGGLLPTHEEVVFWLQAIVCTANDLGGHRKGSVCQSCISKRKFELGIAFLCLVPGLTNSLTANLYRDCVQFLLGPAISGLISYEQGSEIAVWLVVQLLLQCYSHVSEYVTKAIGMGLKIDSMCWGDLCRTARDTGITSNAHGVATAVSYLRATGPICSTKSYQLILECLFQLLKSGHFVRCGVNITESIMHCILLSSEPIHPLMVELIEMFAEASYISPAVSSTNAYRMRPLSCGFLAAALKPLCSCHAVLENIPLDEMGKMILLPESTGARNQPFSHVDTESVVHAIMASYYILCKEQLRQRAGTSTGFNDGSSTSNEDEEIWWSKLLSSLPLSNIVGHMEDHWLSYEHIFPRWVGLAMSLFPERLLVSRLVHGLELENVPVIREKEFSQVEGPLGLHSSVEMTRQVFRNSLVNFMPALKLLKAIHLENISPEIKFELQVVVMEDLLPLLLNKSCSEFLQEAFCEWWCGLEHANVQLLLPLLYHCIKISSMDMDKARNRQIHNTGFSMCSREFGIVSNLYQELVEQPLSLLACRKEIYCTTLLSIFLDLLMELLVKNRRLCLEASNKDGEVNKEEISRALDTRDSAVCQILLENWSGMSSDITIENDLLVKAGWRICAFISSLFYSNPVILRLVHFQGYDIKLVPAIIEGVTQMVHYLEFFEEFLKYVQLPVLAFAIVLISSIVRRHPGHSRSFATAQKAIKHIRGINFEHVTISTGEILEAMAWFAVTFPALEPEVREFLNGFLKSIGSKTGSSAIQTAAVTALRLLPNYNNGS